MRLSVTPAKSPNRQRGVLRSARDSHRLKGLTGAPAPRDSKPLSGAGLRDCPGARPEVLDNRAITRQVHGSRQLSAAEPARRADSGSALSERQLAAGNESGQQPAAGPAGAASEPRRTTVPHLSASDMSSARASSSGVLELNVGGSAYATSLDTAHSRSLDPGLPGPRVRRPGRTPVPLHPRLPAVGAPPPSRRVRELARLKAEAEYFKMDTLVACLSATSDLQVPASSLIPFPGQPGYITLGYRGTFAFGRDGLADVKFRKLTRILVCGKVTVCREVFGDSLNESRDPDRGQDDRYTSRFFLKHNSLEQAFDSLQESRFRCVCACGSGTSCGGSGEPLKPGMDSEENRWNHYNEFVF
ncbi:hypothetical protein HPB47_000150, partial [Ixodes persulcatus]